MQFLKFLGVVEEMLLKAQDVGRFKVSLKDVLILYGSGSEEQWCHILSCGRNGYFYTLIRLLMERIDLWVTKIIPHEVFPQDFKTFIQNKYEYKDPLGEHIYSLQSIALGCKYIIPPGEILDSFNEVKRVLEEEQCDLFLLSDWKRLLGLAYMKQDKVRLLVLNKKGVCAEFLLFIKEAYEYRDPMGDHLYSKESVWLALKDSMPGGVVRDTYFSVWKELDRYNCSWFTFAEDYRGGN